MDMQERPRGKVRLFSCGGGGINIGNKVDSYANANNNSDRFAQLDVVYIDTSRANLRSDIDPESFFLVTRPGAVEGSGQERPENFGTISERVRDILQKFKPADLNIVLSTGGGGSGSVIAPSIVSELLARDCSTIVICVGDDSTRKFAQNTLNTLKSYDRVATVAREQPINLVYLQNSAEMTRTQIDKRIQHVVAALCMLFSARNRELDAKDLEHWLRYPKVTKYKPALASLTLIGDLGQASLDELGNLISIATLTQADHDPALPVRTEVQYVGYLEGALPEKLNLKAPYHYVISDGVLPHVAAQLELVLQEMQEQSDARTPAHAISSSWDVSANNGVVV
ncbi:hypothetical protein [Paraburkholderia adhaesiva]|uniref:hypothetical protein n=1 Tax=Paraburkholderia adhaesiva TaxID=2883244 RepID=UPI001F4298ED|nr:hypothetical protein [Paraburkholderia adhaesiva]